jgi:hypothetical protein
MKIITIFAAAVSLAAQSLSILPGPAPVPVPGGINHEVLVQNTGATPIPGPVGILVNKFDTRAYVENRASIVRSPLGGLAYLMVVDAGPDNVLSPGEVGRTTIRARGESLVFSSSQGPYKLTSVQYPYKVVSVNSTYALASVENVFFGPYTDGDIVTTYNRNSGSWSVRSSESLTALPAFADPLAFTVPITANFSGPGKPALALFNKTTGQWAIRNSNNGAVTIHETPNYANLNPATSQLHLVPADYDGDGLADIAIFNQNTAQFRFRSSRTGAAVNAIIGAPGVTLPLGRFIDTDDDCGHIVKFAAYERTTGRLLVFNTTTSTITPTPLNIAFEADDDHVANAGDVNGDGLTDIILASRGSQRYTIRDGATGQTSFTGLELVPAAQIISNQMTFQQWASATGLHGDDDSDTFTQIGHATLGLKQSIVSASYAPNAAERLVSNTTRVR